MTDGDYNRGGLHGDEGLKIGREGIQPIYDFIAESQEKDQSFFLVCGYYSKDVQLFNLAEDSKELKNVAKAHPVIVQLLTQEINDWHNN